MLWEKGYDKLWDLLEGYQNSQQPRAEGEAPSADKPDGRKNEATQAGGASAAAGSSKEKISGGGGGVALSAYGSGPNSDAIRERAEEMGLAVEFHPATDHAELTMYKTFVNPSQSEVLCTTVAEALAMGKFVVIAEHASNEFFYQFPNTLKFKTQEEFNDQVCVCVCQFFYSSR